MAYDAAVIAAAAASPLLHYDWPDRGVAPHGYTKGMALAFARADAYSGDRGRVFRVIAGAGFAASWAA